MYTLSTLSFKRPFQLLSHTLALFIILLMTPILGRGQGDIEFSINGNGSSPITVTVSNLPGTGCGEEGAYYIYQETSSDEWVDDPDELNDSIAHFLNNTPISKYQIYQGGVTQSIAIKICQPPTPNNFFSRSAWGSNSTGDITLEPINLNWTPGSGSFCTGFAGDFNPPNRGATNDFLIFRVEDEPPGIPVFDPFYIVIPVLTEGILYDDSNIPEVEILDTILQPKIPYLILHDPPGDQSTAMFSASTTFCRSYEQSITSAQSNSFNGAIKLGVKGSIGIIATIDYELSTTFEAGFEMTRSQTSTESEQVCMTTTESFQTSDLAPNINDGDEVFIGYGVEMYLGVFGLLKYDPATCDTIIEKGIALAEKENTQSTFIYTKIGIEAELDELQNTLDNETLDPTERINAENQIDVWNKILELNNQNKASTEYPMGSVSFNAGTGGTFAEETLTETTRTLTTEHATKVNAGFSVVAEIGGSGVSANYEFTTEHSFGASTSVSNGTTQIISYNLNDDDSGDLFNMDIYRDPMYGTPVFHLVGGRTSCPWEGGAKRDQPYIQNGAPECAGQGLEEIRIDNIPIGTAASVPIKICNASDEERTYYVKMDESTNIFGAVLRMGGVDLNPNDLGLPYTVPAGGCFEQNGNFPQLDILQNPNSPGTLVYEDIKLFVYPECEPGLRRDLLISVQFGGLADGDEDCDGIPNSEDNCAELPSTGFGFDTVGESIEFGQKYPDVADNFTCEFWARPRLNPAFYQPNGDLWPNLGATPDYVTFPFVLHPAAGFFEYGETARTIGVAVGTNGVMLVERRIPIAAPVIAVIDEDISDWAHIAVVYEDKVPYLYINGELRFTGTASPASSVHPTHLLYAGDDLAGMNIYEGGVDEVRIWDYARSQEEIAANYTKEVAPDENGLITYFNFNEGTPVSDNGAISSLPDLTGNGYDATLTGYTLNGVSSNFVFGAPINFVDLDQDGIGDNCDDEVVITSTDEVLAESSLKVYPNPASTHATLEFKANGNNQVKIELLSASGVPMYTNQVTTHAMELVQVQLPIQNLPAGLYFVVLHNDNKIHSERFVVEHR